MNIRKLLLRILKPAAEEVKEIAVEELRKKWPKLVEDALLVIDGIVYHIISIDDKHVKALDLTAPRKREITANLSDLRYNTGSNHWYLEGR